MLIQMGIGGSLLIIIFLGIRLFLRKYSWSFCKYIAFFPLFRLLLPFYVRITLPFPNTLTENIKHYTPPQFLKEIYLVVSLSLFLYLFIKHLILIIKYKNAVSANKPIIQTWYNRKSKFLPFSIKYSDKATCPFVYGVLRPTIILPEKVYIKDSDLQYLLEHEYTHIIHWDILQKYLLTLILCIHWFNPICWIFFIIVNHDIEFACDENVTTKLNRSEKAEYAKLILSFSISPAPNLYTCKSSDYNKLKKRITEILKESACCSYKQRIKKYALILMLLSFFPSFFPFSSRIIRDNYPTVNLDTNYKEDTKNYVPNVTGMSLENVKKILESDGFFLLSFN